LAWAAAGAHRDGTTVAQTASLINQPAQAPSSPWRLGTPAATDGSVRRACFPQPAGRTCWLSPDSPFCRQDADSTLVAAGRLPVGDWLARSRSLGPAGLALATLGQSLAPLPKRRMSAGCRPAVPACGSNLEGAGTAAGWKPALRPLVVPSGCCSAAGLPAAARSRAEVGRRGARGHWLRASGRQTRQPEAFSGLAPPPTVAAACRGSGRQRQ